MDKARFIEVAPKYYVLALGSYLDSHAGIASKASITTYFAFGRDNSLLEKQILFDRAVEWFVDQKMIEAIPDDFAPPLYVRSNTFHEQWRELKAQPGTLFHRHSIAPDPEEWLREALYAVNERYDLLEIETADFHLSELDQWEPLALDRSDPKLQVAIEKLDETIEQIRADNGYSATQPEERSYVLEALTSLSKKLKTEATVSWMYLLEFGLKPLARVSKRFTDNATGLIAKATEASLLDWMKGFGVKAIEFIARNMF
jgi:hypothetical protein